MTEPEDRTDTAHPEVAGPGPRVPAAFCPYLGLADDPATHFAFPSTAQRCHSGRRAAEIDLTKQARDCLTAQHVTCSRYRPIPTPGPTQPGRAGVVFRLARPSERLAPVDPAAPGTTPPTAPGKTPPTAPPTAPQGRRSRRRAVEWLLVVLLVIAVAAVGIAIGGLLAQQLRDGAGAVAASQDTGPAVSPAQPSVLTPSPEPASPVPGTSDRPTETAAPTSTPTATPAPRPVVHVVRRGETLKAIAERYGVSQRSIVRANSLENPSLIAVGQKLIIPSP